MKKLAISVILCLLLAPAPWGIALNYTTKQCAGYWAGDEYYRTALPAGWKAYYPDRQNIIQTEIGSCQWEASNWDKRAEHCCQQLEYTFVSSHIGKDSPTFFTILIIAILLAVALGVLAIVGGIVVLFIGLLTGGGYLVWKRLK